MGREVPVLVDARAEQPLQRLGSGGYGDGRLVWRDLGGVRKRLPVAANEWFLTLRSIAKPLVGRQIEVRLRQVPGHSEALPRRDGGSGRSDHDARPQPLIGHA